MKKHKYYFGGSVHKANFLQVGSKRVEVSLTWADGMVGVIAVFKNKKLAKKYFGKEYQIYECEVENEDSRRF